MKKIVSFLLIFSLFFTNVHSMSLTLEQNGINGEIIVKYDNVESPPILLEGKTIDLTLKIENNQTYNQPQMYVALCENNRVKTIQVINPTIVENKLNFHTIYQLPNKLENCSLRIFLWEQSQKPISNNLQFVDALYSLVYKYDANNRLTSVTFKDKIINYDYNDKGNLLTKTIGIAPIEAISNTTIEQFANAITPVIKTPEIIDDSETEKIIPDLPDEITDNLPNNGETDITNETALKCLVSVEVIDGVTVTTYNLALLNEDN